MALDTIWVMCTVHERVQEKIVQAAVQGIYKSRLSQMLCHQD